MQFEPGSQFPPFKFNLWGDLLEHIMILRKVLHNYDTHPFPCIHVLDCRKSYYHGTVLHHSSVRVGLTYIIYTTNDRDQMLMTDLADEAIPIHAI